MKLGTICRDKINGFQGVAIGRAEYLYGEPQILVAPLILDANGNQVQSQWISEQRLTIVDEQHVWNYI